MGALAIAMGSMGGLGALFSIGLAVANKKLHVEEDPRIAKILDALPGANCGGCGYPGCGAFAEAVTANKIDINGCPVNTPDNAEDIAKIMGVEMSASEKKYARVLCRGGNNETAFKGTYVGIKTCLAADVNGNSEKLCQYGCIGYGDCVRSCPFDAMYMDENGLPVVIDEKCTGCGNCQTACPKGIMEIHPASHNLYITCKSQDETKFAKQACIMACLGCGACTKDPEAAKITIKDNLAIIDYNETKTVSELPTAKCPTASINIINPNLED